MYPSIYDGEHAQQITLAYEWANTVATAEVEGMPIALQLVLASECRFRLALARGYMAIGVGTA